MQCPMQFTHKAVLHLPESALIVPVSNIPELSARLYLSFAYTEVLGMATYDHYDCDGVRKAVSNA